MKRSIDLVDACWVDPVEACLLGCISEKVIAVDKVDSGGIRARQAQSGCEMNRIEASDGCLCDDLWDRNEELMRDIQDDHRPEIMTHCMDEAVALRVAE
jgi:hypothetical protein